MAGSQVWQSEFHMNDQNSFHSSSKKIYHLTLIVIEKLNFQTSSSGVSSKNGEKQNETKRNRL